MLDSDDEASREYGINRNSSLNTLRYLCVSASVVNLLIILRYFHVCNGGLLPDIMHDLLEGVLQYEVKLMLKTMVRVDGYFSLEVFNSRLINTDFGYMEINDKPTPISSTTFSSSGHSLKQAGTLCDINSIK